MINNAFAYAAANDDKTPDMPFPECRRHVPGLHRLPAVPGHPERPEVPRHHALDRLHRDPDRRRRGRPGVPEPHQARGRVHGRGDRQGQGRGHGLSPSRRTPAAAGARWSPPRSPGASWSSTPCAIWWRTATWSCPPAAAGCRSSRPTNGYVGTPAVIDKDRSSALMAAELRRRHADHPRPPWRRCASTSTRPSRSRSPR